jgi:multidrug efflux pump subunit AcrA (membrane-fusion protein)
MGFRGEVPEADVARLPPAAEARVEVGCADCAPIETRLGTARPLADPRTRTVLVEAPLPGDASAFPDGASATAVVLLERSAAEEVLVPVACVVQDELERVVFRRDPAQPGQVVRTVVSLGRRSDGWVEVLSDVAEGDELVRDGVHQLRLTGGGKAPANGHFHADGTWHEGKD